MRKRWLCKLACLALACMMVISLAACGQSAQQPESQQSVTTAAPVSAPASSAAGGNAKVVFWNLYYNTQNESDKDVSKDDLFINKAIKQFEQQNSGISVEILTPPMDNYFNMLKAACVAQNGPDVVMNWVGGPLLDYTKFFIPLDNYFTKDDQAQLVGWDLVRKDLDPNGPIMAVPVGMNGGVYVTYYSKSLFKKAGIDPDNQQPKTWDEFLTLCEKLKKGGVTPFMDGDKEGWNSAWMMGQLWYDLEGFNGILDFEKGNKHFVTDSSFKEAFSAWKKLFDVGYTNPDVASLAQADGQAKFLAGEAAMEIGWSNISKDVVKGLGQDAGWFPLPHLKADAPYANSYLGGYAGYCFSVTNFSKVPDQAVKFIKYMVSADTQDWFVKETQFDFSNNVNSKTPEFPDNPVMAWMWQYMKTTQNKYAVQWDSIVQGDLAQEIYNMGGAMMSGKMSLDDAMKDFDTKYAAITKQ